MWTRHRDGNLPGMVVDGYRTGVRPSGHLSASNPARHSRRDNRTFPNEGRSGGLDSGVGNHRLRGRAGPGHGACLGKRTHRTESSERMKTRSSRSTRHEITACGLLIGLLIWCWQGHAFAQPASGRVGSIVVEGNDKTETDVIVAASGLESGMQVDAAALERVRQRILNRRVFSDVKVHTVPRDNGIDVHIVVDERWTLLPIPFITSSDGLTRGGVFLLETNLFGRLKTFAAGVTFSNQGTSLFGFYNDPSIFGSRWVSRFSILHSSLRQRRRDGSDLVYAYHEKRDDVAGALGYRLAPPLTVFSGGYYLHIDPSASYSYEPPDRPDDVVGVSLGLDLRAANYHSYFEEGVVLRTHHRQGLTGRRPTHSSLQLRLSTRTFDDQSALLFLQYVNATGNAALDAHRLGGQIGTRGFTPLGLWAEHAATATVEYQVPVAHFKSGTWTVNGFCDAGALVWESDSWRFVTPGLSTRFYLKNVAFPAVGLDIGYSTRDERVVTSASVGMSI